MYIYNKFLLKYLIDYCSTKIPHRLHNIKNTRKGKPPKLPKSNNRL